MKMASGISANKLELLQIADAVAREKGIEVEIVLSAMADAIQKAAKARYGQENDIRVDINPKTGENKLLRVVTVVELVENDDTEISLPSRSAKIPTRKSAMRLSTNCRRLNLAASPPKPPSK
jgi:N utilization substance protein A